jgi:2-oxoglutarate dehydrogenase E1 component
MVREVPTYKEPWEQQPAVGAADAPLRPTAAEAPSHPQVNASQAAEPRPPQAVETKPPAQPPALPEAPAAHPVDSSARQTVPRKPPATVDRAAPKLRKQAARNVH